VLHTQTTKDAAHFSTACTVIRHAYDVLSWPYDTTDDLNFPVKGRKPRLRDFISGQICSCILYEASFYLLINARPRRVIEIVPWSSLLPTIPLYFSCRALRYAHPQLFDHRNKLFELQFYEL
jgi:hypothetical protein